MNHPAAECARCGDCCESIPFPRRADLHAYIAMHPPSPEYALTRTVQDVAFVEQHWTENVVGKPGERSLWSCDAFDSETRICTAYDDRPPVCQNYPWYEGRQHAAEHAGRLPPRCSFRADFPEVDQPVTLLPTKGAA